ncbi:hypothetical protein GCM10023156_53440 [Novipirellula rosea]|uniref:Uncharacterized protein n=1 Tax=Novipirellula rosea TaxID=1031540 RepID=A0ABP8NDJ4_9BACT
MFDTNANDRIDPRARNDNAEWKQRMVGTSFKRRFWGGWRVEGGGWNAEEI